MSWSRFVGAMVIMLVLVGCGDTPVAPQATTGQEPQVQVPTANPSLNLDEPKANPNLDFSKPIKPNTEPQVSILGMPIIGMSMDTTPKLDDQGILRSLVDGMPILPGDPNVAPMPNVYCGSCSITQTLELERNNGQK